MKIIFLVFVFSFTLFAAHIDEFASNMGYYRDYNKALSQAKKEDKVIMLVIIGDYCPWCRKFERKTLQRAKVAINVQNNFIPLIVDKNYDKDKYPARFSTQIVPTVYYIEPKKEQQLFQSLGYIKRDEYQEQLNGIFKSYQGMKK
ncbi:thioredoxin family protein [Sulfurimonas sp.]